MQTIRAKGGAVCYNDCARAEFVYFHAWRSLFKQELSSLDFLVLFYHEKRTAIAVNILGLRFG